MRSIFIVFQVSTLLLLASCGAAGPSAPTSTPTAPPVPTSTPAPTLTPAATDTVAPTNTPEPTQTPSPAQPTARDWSKDLREALRSSDNNAAYDAASDALTLDNSASNAYTDLMPFSFKPNAGFALSFQLQTSQQGNPRLASIKLTDRLSDPNKNWWQDVRRVDFVSFEGTLNIDIRDGSAEQPVNIPLELPENTALVITFLDPNGKRFTVSDADGKPIKTVDVTTLAEVKLPDGLFPEGVVYVGRLIGPNTKLTINRLSLVERSAESASSAPSFTLDLSKDLREALRSSDNNATYDAASDALTLDNSTSNAYTDLMPFSFKPNAGFALSFQLQTSQQGNPRLASIKLTDRLSDPNKNWWQDVRRVDFVSFEGTLNIDIRDGSAEQPVNIPLELPENTALVITFLDPNGKRFTVSDADGKPIKTVDVTTLAEAKLPDGLFPEGVVYVGRLIGPNTKLTINRLSLVVNAQ